MCDTSHGCESESVTYEKVGCLGASKIRGERNILIAALHVVYIMMDDSTQNLPPKFISKVCVSFFVVSEIISSPFGKKSFSDR